MPSRNFFGYDPYDYCYPSPPSSYTYPYYHNPAAFSDFEDTVPAVRRSSPHGYDHRPAPARAPARYEDAFFRDVESPETVMREAQRTRRRSSTPASIPIEVTGPDSEPARKTAGLHAPPANAAVPKKSAEEAAVTVQAAARGLLARRMMREVRAVEREAEAVAARVAAEGDALREDSRRRIGVGEELMRLVLRLDAVRGVREYRKRVTRKVLALQDAVDALEAKPAQATEDTPVSAEAESLAAESVEMSETQDAVETGMAPELTQTGEQDVQIGADIAADSSATAEMDMEVDGGRAEEAATEAIAEDSVIAEQAAEAEGEWEMVTGDDAFAGENTTPKAQQQEAAGEETEVKKTEAATTEGLDAKKVMEMVAALCERSAQQCELIGALAARVDTLERTVRRMDEADRRRRKIKKIKKEGKTARSFYSD